MSPTVKRTLRRVCIAVAGSALGLSCPLWPARLKPACEVAGHVVHAVVGLSADGCEDR